LERPRLFERIDRPGDGGILLADSHIHRVDRTEAFLEGAVGVAVLVVDLGLIDDRIDRDGGLSGLTVTNDQFTLAATNRNHRIDGHDPGLQRLIDRFARDDARSDLFDRIRLGRSDRALAVHRLSQRIDHAPKQRFADGNRKQFSGGARFGALLEVRNVAETDYADSVFFEIQCDPHDAAGKGHHLIIHDLGEALDAGDTICHGNDCAGVGLADAGGETGDFVFDLFEKRAHGEEVIKFLKLPAAQVGQQWRRRKRCRPGSSGSRRSVPTFPQ